jgi:hypothetical protein
MSASGSMTVIDNVAGPDVSEGGLAATRPFDGGGLASWSS